MHCLVLWNIIFGNVPLFNIDTQLLGFKTWTSSDYLHEIQHILRFFIVGEFIVLNLFYLILDEVIDLHSYSSYFRLSFYRPRAFFSVTKKNVDLVQKYKTVFCDRNQIKGQNYCNLHFFPFNLLYCLLSMLFFGIVYFYTKIDFIVEAKHVIFNYSTLF